MTVAPARGEQLPAVRGLVDEVFLRSRGRSGSVRERFPGLLEEGGDGEAVVAVDDGEVVATVTWRPFTWNDGERRWRAAMVGLVATRGDRRGQGLGSAVMRGLHARLEEREIEAAVLWSTREDIYARLGWRSGDPGVCGEAKGLRPGGALAGVEARPLDAALAATLVDRHARCEAQHLERRAERLLAVPPPADRVVAYLAGDDAYALVGHRGDEAFVFELVGRPGELPALWAAVRAAAGRVVVNERRGSPVQRWLADQGVDFAGQNLARWLALSAAARTAPLAQWHIPWLDRI